MVRLKIFLPLFFLFIIFINFFVIKKAQDILDQQTSTAQLLQTNKVNEEIIFWQKITEEFPSFRDAYLKLAILNYKINRLFDSQKFLNKAIEIDPNNEVVKKISSLL